MAKPEKKEVKESKEVKQPKLPLSQLAMMAEKSKKFDPAATKLDVVANLRYVQEANPEKFISRNFYRVNGKYSEKTWGRYFGTMEEFRSEAKLQNSRSGRLMEKRIAKHASLDENRKFYRLEIEPWVEKYAKSFPAIGMKKMIVASDFHDIEADLFCLEVFIDTCRIEQPDIIVLNGDIFDMYEFSRFDKDPRKIKLVARMEFVRDMIFARLRKVCPNAQIDFVIGNHEHRILRHMASRSPDLFPLMDFMNITLAEMLGLDPFEINLVSKGNTTAYMAKEIREEMGKNWKMYFGCLVCNHTGYEGFGMTTISGHVHTPELKTEVLLKMGPISKLVTGCMCKLDADYTGTKNNWQQSFAIAYVDPVNERVQLDHVIFTDYFVNVNGRYYYRNVESTEIRDAQKEIDAIKAEEIRGFVNNDEETAVVAGYEKAKKANAIND